LREFTDYTRKAKGGRLKFISPFDTYFYGSIGYGLEEVEVLDVDDDAADVFKDQQGKSKTSAIELGLIYDSRDDNLYPSKGTYNRFDTTVAGPGGDNYYIKYRLRSSWYFPLFWDTVLMTRGMFGWGVGWNGQELPVFERFFLGGINTIRGFESGSVGPRDPETGDVVGGDKMVLFNVEFIFPIQKGLQLRGVVFYDRGNAYLGEVDLSDMRDSVGVGLRWLSPLGPLRLEWGYNLDPQGDEEQYEWAFTVGGTF
jgi:outer membrane protein insertion porin family